MDDSFGAGTGTVLYMRMKLQKRTIFLVSVRVQYRYRYMTIKKTNNDDLFGAGTSTEHGGKITNKNNLFAAACLPGTKEPARYMAIGT